MMQLDEFEMMEETEETGDEKISYTEYEQEDTFTEIVTITKL